MKTILILEDDAQVASALEIAIRAKAKALKSEVEVLKLATEYEFGLWLKGANQNEVQLAIVDMMLRYTNPAADMPVAPPQIRQEGFHYAGLRCARALREKGISSIIWTALDPAGIPFREGEAFQVVTKSDTLSHIVGLCASALNWA